MKLILVLDRQQAEDHEVHRLAGQEHRREQAGAGEGAGGKQGGRRSAPGKAQYVRHVDHEGGSQRHAAVDGRHHRRQQHSGEDQPRVVPEPGIGQAHQQPQQETVRQARGDDHGAQAEDAHGQEKSVGGESRQHHPHRNDAQCQGRQDRKQAGHVFVSQAEHPHYNGGGEDGQENSGVFRQTQGGAGQVDAGGYQQGRHPAGGLHPVRLFRHRLVLRIGAATHHGFGGEVVDEREVEIGLEAGAGCDCRRQVGPGEDKRRDRRRGDGIGHVVHRVGAAFLAEMAVGDGDAPGGRGHRLGVHRDQVAVLVGELDFAGLGEFQVHRTRHQDE